MVETSGCYGYWEQVLVFFYLALLILQLLRESISVFIFLLLLILWFLLLLMNYYIFLVWLFLVIPHDFIAKHVYYCLLKGRLTIVIISINIVNQCKLYFSELNTCKRNKL